MQAQVLWQVIGIVVAGLGEYFRGLLHHVGKDIGPWSVLIVIVCSLLGRTCFGLGRTVVWILDAFSG